MTAKDRAHRLEIHKLHTISQLAMARLRNRWLTNDLLKVKAIPRNRLTVRLACSPYFHILCKRHS